MSLSAKRVDPATDVTLEQDPLVQRYGTALAARLRTLNFQRLLGAIIQRDRYRGAVYFVSVLHRTLYYVDLATGARLHCRLWCYARGELLAGYQVLERPSQGYAPPVASLAIRENETREAYLARITSLSSYISERISEQDTIAHRYGGVFWRCDAAERLAAEAPSLAPVVLSRAQAAHIRKSHRLRLNGKPGFCGRCAIPIKAASAESCYVCIRRTASLKTRFCNLCGKELILTKSEKFYVRICAQCAA
ncbi:hypothetical protein KBA73_02730 [Patescibacteria group bacterium]|nr:hypothetical protein [Patescibacteria group bacterium]